MENENIMTNEIVERTEDFAPISSGNGWKIAGGIAVAVGLLFGCYKFISKRKAKKESIEVESVDYIEEDVEE